MGRDGTMEGGDEKIEVGMEEGESGANEKVRDGSREGDLSPPPSLFLFFRRG
jgi:hypothetical protein